MKIDEATKQLEKFEDETKLTEASPTIVKAVQVILIHFGLLDDASQADGIAGKKTLLAFSDFKEKEYLGNPQVLGSTTAKVLLQAYKEHPSPVDDSGVPAGEKVIRLPNNREVYSSMPVYEGSHFSWGEMTKNLTRIPDQKVLVANIVALARHLDALRDYLGDRAISINSAYRPPAVNRAVGGVSNSRHILGDAADIVVEGLTPYEVYDRLNDWHGSKGGLGKSSVFTHIDMRGYRARFRYGR